MPVVIVQNWMELERGWGTRPDGFTVHASVEARNTHAQWYHATFNASAVVPDEYTTTSGDAFPVDADDAVPILLFAERGDGGLLQQCRRGDRSPLRPLWSWSLPAPRRHGQSPGRQEDRPPPSGTCGRDPG